MNGWLIFWFASFPYVCLSIMAAGLCFRYLNAPETWNSHSTVLMETRMLRLASPLFHAGAILAVGGHAIGLLVPEGVWVFLLGSADAHDVIALFAGKFIAVFMLVGLGVLVARKLLNDRVKASSESMDLVVSAVMGICIITGLYQVYIGQAPLFLAVGPWLRGLLILQPDPTLLGMIPLYMQIHVIAAFLLFALLPFSRLVHIFSAPFTYALRPFLVYRKHHAEPQ